MEIKCNFHHQNVNNIYSPDKLREAQFRGRENILLKRVGESADKFVRRPVASKSATGLHGLIDLCEGFFEPINKYAQSYIDNIEHTYEHKKVFAMLEKEFFVKKYKREMGREKNIHAFSMLMKSYKDMFTHDLDKLILYVLGFPRNFVSKFHRKISEHHVESGKHLNLNSMLCDNVASNPVFKPEKKLSLRDYYSSSPELQGVKGLGELLEKYDYGEHIDVAKLKQEQKTKQISALGVVADAAKFVPLIIANFM